MNDEKISEEWDALLFGVRRSIRYHLHRQKFFERWDTWFKFFTIVTGGTVVGLGASGTKNWAEVTTGAIIAILGSLDLVVGFSTKSRDHHDLVKDFTDLEIEMTDADEKRTAEDLAKFTNQRLKIEKDEPPILRVLNMYCHNELCRAMGVAQGEWGKIGLWRSIWKEWFDWMPNGVIKYKEDPKWIAKEKKRNAELEAADHFRAKQTVVKT